MQWRKTELANRDYAMALRNASVSCRYLNFKVLHRGTLLQPWPNFNGNYVIPSPQLKSFFPETRWRPKKKEKKVFAENWSVFFSLKSSKDRRKRSSPQFGTIFCWNFRIIRAGWLLIVSSCSAQISMSGRLSLDGETLNLDGGGR